MCDNLKDVFLVEQGLKTSSCERMCMLKCDVTDSVTDSVTNHLKSLSCYSKLLTVKVPECCLSPTHCWTLSTCTTGTCWTRRATPTSSWTSSRSTWPVWTARTAWTVWSSSPCSNVLHSWPSSGRGEGFTLHTDWLHGLLQVPSLLHHLPLPWPGWDGQVLHVGDGGRESDGQSDGGQGENDGLVVSGHTSSCV